MEMLCGVEMVADKLVYVSIKRFDKQLFGIEVFRYLVMIIFVDQNVSRCKNVRC